MAQVLRTHHLGYCAHWQGDDSESKGRGLDRTENEEYRIGRWDVVQMQMYDELLPGRRVMLMVMAMFKSILGPGVVSILHRVSQCLRSGHRHHASA